MKKIKIVHVLNTGEYSGAENVVITLIKNCNENIEFVYASPDGSISNILKKNNINHYIFKGNKVTIREIKDMVKKENPDIIHAHDFNASFCVALSGSRIPIISHLHNNFPWLKTLNLRSIIYKNIIKRFDKIFVVSPSVINEFKYKSSFLDKATVIGNPINTKEIISKKNKATKNQDSDLLFLGRLEKQKNPFLFIDIVKKLASENENIKSFMVGDGSLRTEVEKKIKQFNLEENIKVVGFCENPYGLLNNTKLLCMPSLWEGFGLAAIEALTLGKPVIASPVGGLVNIVDDACGKLCISLDEYVEEINKLLNDEDYLELKSKAAINRSLELDNIDEYKNEILATYKWLEEGKKKYDCI